MADEIATLKPHPLDSYFAKMMATPYLKRRRVMRYLIQEPPRRFHYKYRALTLADPTNKSKGFTAKSIDRLRDLIVRSRLYLTPPAEFNDPFDTAARMVVEGTPAQLQSKLESWLTDQGVVEPQRRAESMQELKIRSPEALAEMFKPALEKVRWSTGVVCFAGDPRSTLLWSHYAAEHAGVCIQLETARDFPILSRAVTVDYESEYPTINWLVDYQEGVQKMLLGKHPCWIYEDETRIILDGQAGKFLPFRPDALRAVVFGCRADLGVHAAVDSLLAEREKLGLPPVSLYRAHLHGSRYRLVIKSDAG